MSTPLELAIYDKTFKQVGTVGAPKFVTVQPAFMRPGTLTFSVLSNFRHVDKLMAPGARVWAKDAAGRHLLSGYVARVRGTGPENRALLEFDVVGDSILFQYMLGWVRPTFPITSQNGAGTNWTQTGPAETVFKAAFSQNATRLGLPVTVPATLGRGATVTGKLRFQTLYDRLIQVEDGAGILNSGIGLELRQHDTEAGFYLDTWVPRTVPQRLTEQSGIVKEWSYSLDHPTATRGVIGGQGEGELRVLREKIAGALEGSFGPGFKREFFRDGRDTADPTELYKRLDETLAENAAKASLSVSFGETGRWKYLDAYRVGDTVSIGVGGQVITDRLDEATLSWTADEGYTSSPRLGERTDPDSRLVKFVQAMARSLRGDRTNR